MQSLDSLALVSGIAVASGVNVYAAVFTLGIFALTGHVELPAGLEVLSDPLVLGAAGLMYCVEFFADKIPGLDSLWDAIHTFIRIPAAIVLSASAAGDVSPELTFAAALIGGSLATASHATKASSRLVINSSPEPVSNWTASIGEDLAVIAGLWTALNYPILFLVILAIIILVMVWLLPKLWRGVKQLWQILRSFGRRTPISVISAENKSELLIEPSVTKMKHFETKDKP